MRTVYNFLRSKTLCLRNKNCIFESLVWGFGVLGSEWARQGGHRVIGGRDWWLFERACAYLKPVLIIRDGHIRPRGGFQRAAHVGALDDLAIVSHLQPMLEGEHPVDGVGARRDVRQEAHRESHLHASLVNDGVDTGGREAVGEAQASAADDGHVRQEGGESLVHL